METKLIQQLREELYELKHRVGHMEALLTQLEESSQNKPQTCPKMSQSLLLASAIFEHTLEAVMVTDPSERILAVNQAFASITGYTKEEILGRTPRILASGKHDHDFYRKMWGKLKKHGNWQGELWNRRKNGEIYAAWLNISIVHDQATNEAYYVAVFSDITSRKEFEAQMHHQAFHDGLTGLPNRLHFQDKFCQTMQEAESAKTSFAVLFLDLDGFKEINDTLGHATGDLLLQAISLRMKSCLRKKDVIARLGGDEFILLLPLARQEQAQAVAEKLIHLIGQPYVIRHHTIQMTTSIGISIYPKDGSTREELIQKADQAMYAAKGKGKNQYEFWQNQ